MSLPKAVVRAIPVVVLASLSLLIFVVRRRRRQTGYEHIWWDIVNDPDLDDLDALDGIYEGYYPEGDTK